VNVSSQSGQARIAVSFDLAFGENVVHIDRADYLILGSKNVRGHRPTPSRNDDGDVAADSNCCGRSLPAYTAFRSMRYFLPIRSSTAIHSGV
jgi:hypothetical protein